MTILSDYRYDHPNDVAMRLKGTMVMYKGEPFFVHDIAEMNCVGYHPRKGTDIQSVHSSDSDLVIEAPRLGYINFSTGDAPVFAMRSPRNSQRQGVNLSSLSAIGLDGEHIGGLNNGSPTMKAVAKMMANDYPSFEKAAALVKADEWGCAFSKDWCLCQTKSDKVQLLYHKGVSVATYNIETKVFLFRKGALNKTRKMDLNTVLDNFIIGAYVINEQS